MGKDFIQGLTSIGIGNIIYVEKISKTNMTEPNKMCVLSLHYNGDDSYLFVNGVQELKFKAQSFTNDMKSEVFCIGNIISDWSSQIQKKLDFMEMFMTLLLIMNL